MKVFQFVTALLILFSVWLLTSEQAAQPEQLSQMHREMAVCKDCLIPWLGVGNECASELP